MPSVLGRNSELRTSPRAFVEVGGEIQHAMTSLRESLKAQEAAVSSYASVLEKPSGWEKGCVDEGKLQGGWDEFTL